MIHLLDGQTDKVLHAITQRNVLSNAHKQSLKDYIETFDFRALADSERAYAADLTKLNRVVIPSEDEGYREFIIHFAEKFRDRTAIKADVRTVASYLLLKKAKVIEPQSLSGYTPSRLVGFSVTDTEWTTGRIEITGTRTLHIEEHTNPFSFLKTIANEFDAELRFRVETDGNKITGRYVDLLDREGRWQGREVTFGKDLENIRRKEDPSNIYTALLCIAPEDSAGNRLESLVEDFDALSRWGRINKQTGELQHLIGVYEPESTRQDMTVQQLRQYGRTELNKRINAVVEYEANIIDLEHVPGMENKKIRFGDTIRVKDETFNPPLYLEARIHTQERDIFVPSRKQVELGDFIEYTEEEVKAIWKTLQEEIRQRVSHYEMVEYTYNKLTIDNKDETVFEDGKTFSEATGIQAREDAKAYAEEQDQLIKVSTENYADLVATSALDQAKMYAVAQEAYDLQMGKIATDIADRAPIEYVDGKLVIVEDRLEDFNVEIEKKADGSSVYTIEDVDNMINNLVSVTQYEADQAGIISDIRSHGTRIGQNETAIGLKADDTKLNNIEQSLSRQIGNVEIKANAVDIKVSDVRADLDGLEIVGRNILGNSKKPMLRTNNASTHPLVRTEYDDFWRYEPQNGTGLSTYSTLNDSTYPIYNKDWLGKDMVVSMTVRVSEDVKLRFAFSDWGASPKTIKTDYFDVKASEGWVTLKMPISKDDISKNPNTDIIRFFLYTADNDNATITPYDGYVDVKDWFIGFGTKVPDWFPSPEDSDAKISEVNARVSSAEGSIQTLAGEVTAKASQSEVNALTGRVSTAEGQLNILPGQIEAKVSKDGVVGAINATPEKLLIDFDKVQMTGELEAKHIKSLAGLNINDQFKVDSNGRVTIGNNRINIDSDGFRITRPDGAVWVQDGLVNTTYSIVGFDPAFGDNYRYNFGNGNVESYAMFNPLNKWYNASADAMTGYGGYEDVRDSGLGYSVGFQRYEFSHDSRYLIIGWRRAINSSNPRHNTAIYDVSDGATNTDPNRHERLHFQWHDRGGGNVVNMVIDLGKPDFTKKAIELRIGMNKADRTSSNDTLKFRVNRIYPTDNI